LGARQQSRIRVRAKNCGKQFRRICEHKLADVAWRLLSLVMRPRRVAILTAGGLAPCLNASIAGLIERYSAVAPDIGLLCYRGGYKGLLLGDSFVVSPAERSLAGALRAHGGSAIGNSRVKLTNVKDCVKRGLVSEGQNPLQVAAEQLVRDGVDVLHTIGGDDTNTTAADLAAYLAKNNYELTVIGLPKTIDNDVVPIRQSLGAWTAADEGARFFARVVAEHGANPRMLIVHEVMGRNCGWLTAATAAAYQRSLDTIPFAPVWAASALRSMACIFRSWPSTFRPKPPGCARSWIASAT
jgi:pyrophosphate--fructose-6-phosphate 1-phosphotransferase